MHEIGQQTPQPRSKRLGALKSTQSILFLFGRIHYVNKLTISLGSIDSTASGNLRRLLHPRCNPLLHFWTWSILIRYPSYIRCERFRTRDCPHLHCNMPLPRIIFINWCDGCGYWESKAWSAQQDISIHAINLPEPVYIAQRVQTNQVEQLPGFLISSISFTILVNGKVGALLSTIWAVLRRGYAAKYKASVGKSGANSGIATFTIPAYFAMNSMLMGTVVQCIRVLVNSR